MLRQSKNKSDETPHRLVQISENKSQGCSGNYRQQARHLARKKAFLILDHLRALQHQYNTPPCNLLQPDNTTITNCISQDSSNRKNIKRSRRKMLQYLQTIIHSFRTMQPSEAFTGTLSYPPVMLKQWNNIWKFE